MRERVAVYAGTRNVYDKMVTAAKSLLYHDGADTIYFLIEDNTFPSTLPPCIHCMNVSNQSFFHQSGPNYNTRWTYMILLRSAFTKLFPQHDIILSLDNDTIVNGDISQLWQTDLSGAYFAGVQEIINGAQNNHQYYNFGVILMNLAMLRDGTDDMIIRQLNTTRYNSPEQDAFSSVCTGHIKPLPPEYNCIMWNLNNTGMNNALILHLSGSDSFYEPSPVVWKYRRMPWDSVIKHKSR